MQVVSTATPSTERWEIHSCSSGGWQLIGGWIWCFLEVHKVIWTIDAPIKSVIGYKRAQTDLQCSTSTTTYKVLRNSLCAVIHPYSMQKKNNWLKRKKKIEINFWALRGDWNFLDSLNKWSVHYILFNKNQKQTPNSACVEVDFNFTLYIHCSRQRFALKLPDNIDKLTHHIRGKVRHPRLLYSKSLSNDHPRFCFLKGPPPFTNVFTLFPKWMHEIKSCFYKISKSGFSYKSVKLVQTRETKTLRGCFTWFCRMYSMIHATSNKTM